MKKYKEFLNENYIRDLAKIKSIIKSCNTSQQTESAYKTLELWKNKWEDESPSQDLHELDRMIQDKDKETNVE